MSDNPLFSGRVGGFYGLQIIEDRNLTVTVEDWSRVRSPSRAARRLKRGHRQNIDYLLVPDPTVFKTPYGLVMHPELARKLREATNP